MKKSRKVSASAVLLVVFFAAAVFLALHLVRSEKGLQWISSKFKTEEPVDPGLSALRLERAAGAALTELGVGEEQLSVEGSDSDGTGSGPKLWEAPLPAGVSLEKANLAVTEAVGAAGGRIVDGREWRTRRGGRRGLTLIAATDSAQCLEMRLYETPASEKKKDQPAARLAVIVGGMGRELDDTAKLLIESPLTITVAVLPGRPASKKTAGYAEARGKEVLLHLPMEPTGYPGRDPGKGALLLDQSAGEIRRTVREDIEELGCASGVVNYMGSAATRDRDLMRAALREIKRHGLFFVDSSASVHSLAAETAKALGVPCIENDLFLEPGAEGSGLLGRRLDRAERIALQRGVAVVLAGPTRALLDLLASRARDYPSRGIVLVRASDLVRD